MSSRQGIRALVLASVLGVPFSALADATVSVQLRSPDGSSADGTVVLSKGEARFSCTTKAGKCAIEGVAGGLYTVTVEQPGKQAPKPKQVMIPPDGEVDLIVRGGK